MYKRQVLQPGALQLPRELGEDLRQWRTFGLWGPPSRWQIGDFPPRQAPVWGLEAQQPPTTVEPAPLGTDQGTGQPEGPLFSADPQEVWEAAAP